MTKETQELIEEAIKLVIDARKIVVFTGTGVSTDSGVSGATSSGSSLSDFKRICLSNVCR